MPSPKSVSRKRCVVEAVQSERTAVLVVEDDREMLQGICRSLRARGYHAEGVRGGREALARLRREEFAAVVADVGLARTHDLDLLREVRGLEGFRPWVMYTGVPDPFAPRWRGQRGVFCVLVKGAPMKDLLWSVEEACRAASRVDWARCA
jgi:two-component system response regulator FlrC